VWSGFNSKGNEMTKSRFTPGPWVAIKNPAFSDCWYVKANGLFLGHAVEENAQANAELMADAPRLLEVLRNLLTYSEPLLGWQHIDEAEQAFTEAHELLEKHGG
jgi:hypothetical protein